MQCQVRGMADANPRVSDTLPKRGRVNEVCREWIVHEDEALAYQLQKQEVEQHYDGNKERNARVRQDFPKAKEEQEKEIAEAADKYRQMIKQQEQMDSTYALHVAEKLERKELEWRRHAEIRDTEVARKMQGYEATRDVIGDQCRIERHRIPVKALPVFVPDVNRVGLPMAETVARFEPMARRQATTSSLALTHNLSNLRLSADDSCKQSKDKESLESCSSNYRGGSASAVSPTSSLIPSSNFHARRAPPPPPPSMHPAIPLPLPDDVNQILTDVDLREEVNKRLQEEKDEELARMLQKQEEQILTEEIDRDRMIAIEAQDEELAKLLYEKEKAKVKRAKERAKERARQRALLKKQQQEAQQLQNSVEEHELTTPHCSTSGDECHFEKQLHSLHNEFKSNPGNQHLTEGPVDDADQPLRSSTLIESRTTGPPMMNVAMHIDPTYLSQQSSSMPNSLMFPDNETTTAPPYMPIQGQRRNSSFIERKPKKSKTKDGCKQQ